MKLFIVTGVSGSGKSTIAKLLRPMFCGDVFEFDELGVPSDLETLEQWIDWRVERTSVLLSKVSGPTVICGSVIPYEFLRFNIKPDMDVRFALLSINKEKIKERLGRRGWSKDLIDNNVSLDSHMRWMMLREYSGIVVDTGAISEKESVNEIFEWIKV